MIVYRDWLIVGKIRPAKKPKIASRIAGGIARAAKLTPERRSEIARKAALERWSREQYLHDMAEIEKADTSRVPALPPKTGVT